MAVWIILILFGLFLLLITFLFLTRDDESSSKMIKIIMSAINVTGCYYQSPHVIFMQEKAKPLDDKEDGCEKATQEIRASERLDCTEMNLTQREYPHRRLFKSKHWYIPPPPQKFVRIPISDIGYADIYYLNTTIVKINIFAEEGKLDYLQKEIVDNPDFNRCLIYIRKNQIDRAERLSQYMNKHINPYQEQAYKSRSFTKF